MIYIESKLLQWWEYVKIVFYLFEVWIPGKNLFVVYSMATVCVVLVFIKLP